MVFDKLKKKTNKGICMFLLVVISVLLISGTVFADGEVPIDGPPAQDSGELEILESGGSENESPGIVPEIESSESENPLGEENSLGDISQESGETEVEENEPQDEPDPAEEQNSLEDDEGSGIEGSDQESGSELDQSEGAIEPGSETEEELNGEDETDTSVDPEVTDVELVDLEGNPLDMADPESINMVSSGDPRWYYGGLWYSVVTDAGLCYEGTSEGDGTCWVSATPISTALEKIDEGRLPNDGKLYVDAGDFVEGNLNISGTYTSQLKGLIGAGSSSTTIIGDISLTITNGFTLSGFTIIGGVDVFNSVGTLYFNDLEVSNPDGDGLMINGFDGENPVPHPSQIYMDGVDFNDNYYNGAYINSKSNVTISNANFNGNGGAGLVVSTTSKITLMGVTANENTGSGINAYDFNSLIAKYISVNNNQAPGTSDGYGFCAITDNKAKITIENILANNNLLSGIFISSNGTVTVKNIEAHQNDESGLVIFTGSAVTVENAFVTDNSNDGLAIYTGNRIKLTGIISRDNDLKGLRTEPLTIGYYDNVLEEWIVTAVLYPTSVTLTSSKTGGSTTANAFSGNGEEGIYILAKGTMTLSNFDAYENGGFGVYLDNYLYDEGSGLGLGKGNVTINVSIPNWTNGIFTNGGVGLYVFSNGVVSINDTTATENPANGMYINTTRAIKLNKVVATSNGDSGAFLTNLAAVKGQSVSITDSIFDGNIDTGLVVLTKGSINLSGSGASDNLSPNSSYISSMPVSILDFLLSSDGADNWWFYGLSGDQVNIILESGEFDALVTIYNSDESWSITDDDGYGGKDSQIISGLPGDGWYRVEVTFNGSFEGQGTYTLSVNDENHDNYVYPGSGVLLDNSAGTAGVTISTSKNNSENNFDANENMGMDIKTNGSITIKGLGTDNNYRSGLVMDNPQSKGKVSFTDKSLVSSFNNNGWSGIYLRTMGMVNLAGIGSISENGFSGLEIDNCIYDEGLGTCLGSGSVILKNMNAERNGGDGIRVYSKGTINLNSIVSNENSEMGISLYNQVPLSIASVLLKAVTADGNNNTGIQVSTYGNVNLGDMNANENLKTTGFLNDGDAVLDYLNNLAGPDVWSFYAESGVYYSFNLFESDIDDLNRNTFSANLELFDADENPVAFDSISGVGIHMLNAEWTPTTSGYYYIEVSDLSDQDNFYRLSINNGAFVDMTYYFVDGISINAGKNVTISGKNTNKFNQNSVTGIYIETPGSIKLQNVSASLNGTEGAYLDNDLEESGTGSITISGVNNLNRSSFSGNGWEGLVITTQGALSINFTNINVNGFSGIDAWGNSKMSAKSVDVIGNAEIGMLLDSAGLVSLSYMNAGGNGTNGLELYAEGVKITGLNNVMDNGENGIWINSNGLVNLSGIDIRRSGQNGMSIWSQEDDAVILNKINVSGSGMHGISIHANAAITLNTVSSLLNGVGNEGDGLMLDCWTPENTTLLIKNSAFMGNEGNGINVQSMNAELSSVILNSIIYYGNDTNDTGDPNILFETIL